jgi:regulator of cell morphogenesis and NO signaling
MFVKSSVAVDTINKDCIILSLVQGNPLLASVVDRFGIPYAQWTLTLEKASEHEDVNLPLLLEMLKVFSDSSYFPADGLRKLPLQSIIEYLIKTHIYYIKSRLPRIEQFIDLLIEHYGRFDMQVYLLKDYFEDYKHDMLAHICIEERQLFPYVLRLIRAKEEMPRLTVDLYNLLEMNSIDKFKAEHHDVENELGEIRRRLSNYSEANHHKVQISTLFYELRLFEIDLLTHGKVESEILIPRAEEIEDSLKRNLLRRAMLS